MSRSLNIYSQFVSDTVSSLAKVVWQLWENASNKFSNDYTIEREKTDIAERSKLLPEQLIQEQSYYIYVTFLRGHDGSVSCLEIYV